MATRDPLKAANEVYSPTKRDRAIAWCFIVPGFLVWAWLVLA